MIADASTVVLPCVKLSRVRVPSQLSRRALGGLAAGATIGLLVGCSPSSREPSDADFLDWLRGLSGVARVEFVPNDEDTTGHSALTTTTPGLPDDDVRALLSTVAKDYDDHAPPGSPSLHVQLDSFSFSGATGSAGTPDLSLERVLWLRGDDRVISADGLSGRFTIITRPGAVADVALGFDAVPGKKGRATQEVRSQDGWTALSWSESSGLGWSLDRPLMQRIADLSRRYPGLEWWAALDPSQVKAGLFFAAADITLAKLVADAERLVRPDDFTALELGWGPARAPYALFARAFSKGKIRAVLDAVVDVPGVAELRVRQDVPGERPSLNELVARTTAGYLAGLEALRSTWDSFVSVSLVREPARYVGQRPQEVFRGSIYDSKRQVRAQAALADLDQVPGFAIGYTFSNLNLTTDISDGQLTSALTVCAGLVEGGGPDPEHSSRRPYVVNVYYRADNGLFPVGRATAVAFVRSTEITPVGNELAGRVQTVWERLT